MTIESASPDENRATSVPCSCAPPTQTERLPHSGCGCLSFAIVLITIGMIFASFGIVFWGDFIPENLWQEHDPDPLLPTSGLIAGLCLLSGFVAAGVALILAISGLCHHLTRKVFAIWGLILSILLLAFYVSIPILSHLR